MKKATDCSKEELEAYLPLYNYYKPAPDAAKSTPALTEELDGIGDADFDELTLLKIILWKVHRYAELENNLLTELNGLRSLKSGDRETARPVLEALLNTSGIDLPMASTILRFRNPAVFQIIDQRAYRSVMPGKDKYDLYTTSSVEKKVSVYFEYLQAIDKLCNDTGIIFFDADRILYQFDKKENGKLKPREGWEEQFRQMHENGDDKMVFPDVHADNV